MWRTSGLGFTISANVKKATPRQWQSNLLQVVTQWKSETSSNCGRALNSSQVNVFGFSTNPADFEAPIFQCDFWFDAEIENREALGEMLARRKAIAGAGSEPDGRISGPGRRFCEAVGRFPFAGDFSRPTFLALNQARVRRRHDRNFNRGSCGLRGFS